MKTFVIGKAYDTSALCSQLSAAGIVADIRADGVIVTDDSAVDATVNAVIAAHDGSDTTTNRVIAAQQAASSTPLGLIVRAGDLVTEDEINILREWLMAFQAAVAGAASLAALKASVALLPALPDRTPAQAKAAIAAKITGGGAD